MERAREKMYYMDHHDVILLDSGEHVWMTAEQVVYNRALIEQEMAQPTIAEKKQMQESDFQWDLSDPRWMKAERTEADSAWIKAMYIRMKAKCMQKIEAEITTACADYKQRFIAEHGQAEWDLDFEPPSLNPLVFAGPRADRSHASST